MSFRHDGDPGTCLRQQPGSRRRRRHRKPNDEATLVSQPADRLGNRDGWSKHAFEAIDIKDNGILTIRLDTR
jgi:hypothetical protein